MDNYSEESIIKYLNRMLLSKGIIEVDHSLLPRNTIKTTLHSVQYLH
jgi:hypothetical protein